MMLLGKSVHIFEDVKSNTYRVQDFIKHYLYHTPQECKMVVWVLYYLNYYYFSCR